MGTFGALQPPEQRQAFLERLRALKEQIMRSTSWLASGICRLVLAPVRWRRPSAASAPAGDRRPRRRRGAGLDETRYAGSIKADAIGGRRVPGQRRRGCRSPRCAAPTAGCGDPGRRPGAPGRSARPAAAERVPRPGVRGRRCLRQARRTTSARPSSTRTARCRKAEYDAAYARYTATGPGGARRASRWATRRCARRSTG